MSREQFVMYFPYIIMGICITFGVRFIMSERPAPAYVSFLLGVILMPFLSFTEAGRKLLPYFYN
jgi:hypothetical protein